MPFLISRARGVPGPAATRAQFLVTGPRSPVSQRTNLCVSDVFAVCLFLLGCLRPMSFGKNFSSCIPFSRALLLLLLVCLIDWTEGVGRVCNICWGKGFGCSGDPTRCPWVVTVAANTAAVAAAAGTVASISSLLPAKFVRLFPKAALQALASLAIKVDQGSAPFNPSGKSEA